jgi:putative toxin-antitoxin system antitoxin component (TIGR02293 family)
MATLAEVPALLPTLRIDLASIEAGLPLAAIGEFVTNSGLEFKDVYEVVIPARTLKHRRDRKEALNLDESDRFARLIRVYDYTVKVFGEKEKALRWLNKPKHRFAERTPIQMLRTESGGRMVEEMLGQIEHGMFA